MESQRDARGDGVHSAIWLAGFVVVLALAAAFGMVVAGLLAPGDVVSRYAISGALATAIGATGAWVTARLFSDVAVKWTVRAAAWLLIGVGVASAAAGALASWAVARFAYVDPDYVGVTLALPVTVMVVVVGSVVRSTTAGGIRRASTILVFLGAAACTGIAVLNLPGLRDGLRSESWGLAVAGGAALLYCVVAAGAAVGYPGRGHRRD